MKEKSKRWIQLCIMTAGISFGVWGLLQLVNKDKILVASAGQPDTGAVSENSVEAEGIPEGTALEESISEGGTIAGGIWGDLDISGTVDEDMSVITVSGGDVSGNDVDTGEQQSEENQSEEQDEYANLAIADVDRYVNVRNKPDTSGEIVGKIYDGAVAQILSTAGENNEWFYIISGEVEGYCKAEYFIYGAAAAAMAHEYVIRYAVVQTDRLNVRSQPDTEAKRIGFIDYGEKAVVLELCGEWIKVQYTDIQEGYVSAEYVTVTEEFIYAKSIEEERAELESQRQKEQREAVSELIAPDSTDTIVLPVQTENANEQRTAIVEYAMQFLGNSYIHGGKSLTDGTDCSGFTCFIYADFGYSISRTPSGQLSTAGRSIEYSEIQPGDIICYTSNGGKSCTHVGLYIGGGEIIHAANSRKGVIVSNADYSTIMGVRNVID